MNPGVKFLLLITAILISSSIPFVRGADWPMWRYDAGRTANSPEALSTDLTLLWSRQYLPREPVWDDPLNQDLMQYDRIFEPIVLEKYLYLGFNDGDKVIALDTETGEQQWIFYTNGPVRLPLVGWNKRIYLTSDDGYLYCLSAKQGQLIWKFRGGPDDRKLLGNKRLISMWPARGGPVIKDGVLYFAASIWPWMGTFIYALDAETGKIIWRNEETNANYIMQPHNYTAYAGIAPQGAFVISNDRLLIPGGRSVPACFDLLTGKQLYYHLGAYGKTGGAFVCANDEIFVNHHRDRVVHLYKIEDGRQLHAELGKYPVLAENYFYFSGKSFSASSIENPDTMLWKMEIDASGDLIKAGSQLYAAGKNHITALQLAENGEKPTILWQKNIDGMAERLIAANGKLFAVTFDGRIMAFDGSGKKPTHFDREIQQWVSSAQITSQARAILDHSGINAGYALFYGVKDGHLLAALAQQSNLQIIAIEKDENKIDQLRQRFDACGIYGHRVTLIPGDLTSVQLPAWFASLTILWDVDIPEILSDSLLLKKIYASIRPYDGVLWTPLVLEQSQQFPLLARFAQSNQCELSQSERTIMLTRTTGLEGADNWTHQYGDITNTVKSDDQLVKMPLGLLWFGGNSNLDVLPRHGHGPPEQVVDGRLIIEGMQSISARDVYTGRVFWKAPLDSLETFQIYYNETYANTPLEASYNQRHIPGANGRGTNFIATHDLVYIIQGAKCKVLDIKNGSTTKILSLPGLNGHGSSRWAYIGVYENDLIAGAGFAQFSALVPMTSEEQAEFTQLSLKKRTDIRDKENYDLTASQALIVMDRYSGDVKWQVSARHGFIHNSIVVANEKLYCLDKLPAFVEKKMKRRGISPPEDYRLLVFDIDCGALLQEINKDVFGSWLSYSEEYDVLLQATSPSPDMLQGEEGKRMIVYRVADLMKLWDQEIEYDNPPILHGDRIITEHRAFHLLTGEPIQRRDPITHEIMPWTYTRTKGCNYSIASEHILSFRSSAAAFFDLRDNGGTGHFGGFKSGCTSNLIAANGVLNAPDYTRTCQCSFQNQTSLALVYMPGVEYWTESDFEWSGQRVKQIGINFNAPGDRMADNGTLWLEFPFVGGPSPNIPVEIEVREPDYIRRHSWFLPGENVLPWVAASAISGISNIQITLSKSDEQSDAVYTIHLHFTELEEKTTGERVFDVFIQDQSLLKNFDIVKEAGGIHRNIVKSFSGIAVNKELKLKLIPSNESPQCAPLLCGIEILMEE